MSTVRTIKTPDRVPVIYGVSSVDLSTPVPVAVDPTTNRLLTSAAGGSAVTSVSVVSANGLAGTVATATTTPAITLETTITGILKGNGTAISAATADTDYSTPAGTETFTNKTYDTAGAGNVLKINGTQVSAVTGSGAVVLAGSPTLTGTVTVPTPVNGTDASTKAYVDATVQGLSIKQSVQAATAAALPANTYNNGSSGVGATLTGVSTGTLTVDGYTVALNDRILVKNETTAANNGIYLCTVAGATGVAYVLTRATDSNTSADIVGGFTFSEQGTVNGSGGFVNTNTGTITIGTTSITYTQFSGAGEIVAGNGLSKSGNTLSIDTAITVDETTAQTLTNKTLTTPVISSISNTGTLTLPTSTDTLVGRATTDTLTNKTLTSPIIGTISNTGTLTLPTSTDTLVGRATTDTLTNKRNEPRVSSTTSTSTLTPDKSSYDVYYLTAQAAALTIANPTGTPVTGEVLMIYVTDNGTSQTLSFGTEYKAFGQALPTATTVSKTLQIGLQFDGTNWSTLTATQQ